MRPNFPPLRGLVLFLFLVLLTSVAPAADKKRKSAESQAASKSKAKPTQKVDPIQQAKSSRDAGRESDKKKKDDQNKQQLARKKKNDEDPDKKRGKDGSKLAAKTREADSRKTAKNAKPEVEKKNEKTKDKSAKREQDKRLEKKEVVAKQAEKAAKSSAKPDTKAELAAAKIKSGSKATKPETQREATTRTEESKKSKRDSSTDSSNSLAKLETRTKPDSKPEPRYPAKEEKAKELPSVKFTLRPIAKVLPKVELKFSVARAVAGPSSDAPPPQDNGPDVIDVIEHDSPEAGRLDDVLRSEMKTLQFSGVPSNSRRKMDVGKMDAERIKQIQEVLAKKGYYSGEITGQYDDVTIEAMRKFQETHKVDVTGYATAQSLRLLGLTDW